VNISFLGIPGPAWGGACVALSVLFAVVWPSRMGSIGIAHTILRWSHSTVWALFALWFFLRSWAPDLASAANILPLLAGLAYAVFVVTLVTAARRHA
jgi:hypothetical protein